MKVDKALAEAARRIGEVRAENAHLKFQVEGLKKDRDEWKKAADMWWRANQRLQLRIRKLKNAFEEPKP